MRTALPALLPSITKLTVPAGVPVTAVTVAVKVTGWPMPTGFADGMRSVVVLIALVQTVQTVGDYLARRVNRRLRHR